MVVGVRRPTLRDAEPGNRLAEGPGWLSPGQGARGRGEGMSRDAELVRRIYATGGLTLEAMPGLSVTHRRDGNNWIASLPLPQFVEILRLALGVERPSCNCSHPIQDGDHCSGCGRTRRADHG